ncbi:MAG: chemotaxis protein [Sulfurimonas sp. RIFOXYD12_FULL_33_39]|uniref:chemotaxis protein n=1 Tax=unclassified Sulfurimonas TaxID=2623549 RepID=UPI0008CF5281|nr:MULTISPECIES: chemotaxis protein [unclassified Sulfurimonas]OHE05937.1 MAG: chemotaxis protein [Sulfurimonas sp. RIFCSPLOWO2_12_FULL_34_6]OHE09744.1 MAG: chemotaxis protein [Sulfurimonas sp. RIFOXYD12_FULL_33_39]OHE13748.1 MAG: chemotaxis protein [Sulfurimonas sp. RIFOXYD2_FULL_34_21]
MTQEELDALMSGDIEDLESLSDDISHDSKDDADIEEEFEEEPKELKNSSDKPAGYSKETAHHWPLPATNENKMVHQLDDVTKESEEKASEIFDLIENVSNELMEKEENLNSVIEVLESNIKLFTTLSEKFPDVEAFSTQLEKNTAALDEATQSLETLQSSGESIMSVMDIMQYQDIHRQKIERVINVMRALSNYMNSLFEGRIDDDKRVSSAQHILGDTHNDTASNEDIEALLAQFGN